MTPRRDYPDICVRDGYGFCVFALAGHRKCFLGSGARPCIETCADEARARIINRAFRERLKIRKAKGT
jgi:hypothetical protein